jgi:hypothetical protein
METKNEIKIVSKELTKYRVNLKNVIDIEVYVYAEDEYEAKQLAEQEVSVMEYSNDSIGVEINDSWNWDISRDNDQRIEFISVSTNGYTEAYDAESQGSISLYAKEEDGFDEYERVYTDEQELLDEIAEESKQEE